VSWLWSDRHLLCWVWINCNWSLSDFYLSCNFSFLLFSISYCFCILFIVCFWLSNSFSTFEYSPLTLLTKVYSDLLSSINSFLNTATNSYDFLVTSDLLNPFCIDFVNSSNNFTLILYTKEISLSSDIDSSSDFYCFNLDPEKLLLLLWDWLRDTMFLFRLLLIRSGFVLSSFSEFGYFLLRNWLILSAMLDKKFTTTYRYNVVELISLTLLVSSLSFLFRSC
jgi:hypothetical protein